jgi:hypothetical protein
MPLAVCTASQTSLFSAVEAMAFSAGTHSFL